jgi:NAD(P)-dependent dehydrogenase (short-subunit alcohol dehydrogenase family)
MAEPAAAGAVLVTGCSSGIGRATAERLARGGFSVYASARRLDSIADLAGAGCRLLELDVTDDASAAAAVAAVEEAEGAVGALVNNAGYSQSGAVESVSLELARRQLETNVLGAARLCRLVLPGMRAAGRGRIVNVSSMGGKLVLPGAAWYHASKYALEAFSDGLRFEVRGFGIDVVVVEPGLVKTSFAAAATEALAGVDPGPYAGFDEAVGRITREAYAGSPLARFARGPEATARMIERALRARRPRPRYADPSARALLVARRALPDRVWDAAMRRVYPPPG